MPAVNSVDSQALATLQARIDADPEIQSILKDNAARIKATHDRGGSARKFQKQIEAQITSIAKRKGYLPPGQVFINPNDGKIEGKGGWAGLPTAAKIAIIGGAAAGGLGIAGAAGAFGGAAGGGAGAGAGGAILPSTSLAGSAAMPAATAGVGNMTAGALTAAGAGGKMGIGSSILGFLKSPKNWGTILDTAKSVAPVLGGASRDQAAARSTEAQQQILRDRLNLDRASRQHGANMDASELDLERRRFGLSAPAARMSNSARGSILSRAHNVGVGQGGPVTLPSGRAVNPITYTGIGADDLIGQDTRDLGALVAQQMLEQQRGGDSFEPLAAVDFPGSTAARGESATEKILGGAATGTSILGALSPILKRRKKTMMTLEDDLPYEEGGLS